MSIYDNFKQEDLVDLLKAYDSYVSTAADAGLLTSGWTPVCVEEFYDNEYQNVWKQGESFDYLYDYQYYMFDSTKNESKSFDMEEEPEFSVNHLLKFIEQEVPFRMEKIHEVDVSKDVMNALIEELKDNTDVMFDYDRLDEWLWDKYEEFSKEELAEDLLTLISDYREDLGLYNDELDAIRENGAYLVHILSNVKKFLEDAEIGWNDIDMSHYSKDSNFSELKNVVNKAYKEYKEVCGIGAAKPSSLMGKIHEANSKNTKTSESHRSPKEPERQH